MLSFGNRMLCSLVKGVFTDSYCNLLNTNEFGYLTLEPYPLLMDKVLLFFLFFLLHWDCYRVVRLYRYVIVYQFYLIDFDVITDFTMSLLQVMFKPFSQASL